MKVNGGTEYILYIYSTSEYISLLKKYFIWIGIKKGTNKNVLQPRANAKRPGEYRWIFASGREKSDNHLLGLY